jgi:hypothetical protein
MKTKKAISFLLLIALLASGLLMTSCPGETVKEEEEGEPFVRQVQVALYPSAIRKTAAEWAALSPAEKTIKVTLSESVAASFQWYDRGTDPKGAGTPISGATTDSFVIPISNAGTNYYYVVVTVGENTITSGNAVITIGDATLASTSFTIGADRVHYVRGIGGTGSFMFRDGGNADASPDADVKYIDMLMGEMGCNILRIMVQDDYLNYINNDVQSKNRSVFYHDAKANFFAVIKRANQLNGYVYANPWTAPGQYKANGAVRGGNITDTPANFVGYANYLRNFLKWLNENGAPIFALGILNEPDNGASADYEGMGMSETVHRDWFRTVGHFTTQYVTNPDGAGVTSSIFEEGIIPGYGGGKPTHHVLAMTADNMGNPSYYNQTINNNTGTNPANNNFEILGRHWYQGSNNRVALIVGTAGTIWDNRPQQNYAGAYEEDSLGMSPHMYAPGSQPGNIKREVWQTEHDFNYWSNSTNIPSSNVQRYWNSAFAAMNDVDWGLRVMQESVFDWWFSQSYSGLVTSYQGTPPNGNGGTAQAGATPWPAHTYTPRGRAYAHYARYVSETWSLPITQDTGTTRFNQTTTSFNAGATDPKISAFEDVNGKFISIVMFTPNASTNTANIAAATSSGAISASFGAGGTNGTDDPTRLSANVGRVEIVLPDNFTATGASALRSYGWVDATGEAWDDVPTGTPRYWINEPVFLYKTTAGKWAVEVNLPGGNIISIMVKGTWAGRPDLAVPERVRPFTVQ